MGFALPYPSSQAKWGILFVALLLAGCDERADGYLAASAISENGFAANGKGVRQALGREILLWGYVDHANLYGHDGARQILAEWWSGHGPSATTWRFNLKAKADDPVGRSFQVHVPNDPGRDVLLTAFLADARAGKPTKVFLKGRLFTFDAPTNASSLIGLYMELQSSQDILLREEGQVLLLAFQTELGGKSHRCRNFAATQPFTHQHGHENSSKQYQRCPQFISDRWEKAPRDRILMTPPEAPERFELRVCRGA